MGATRQRTRSSSDSMPDPTSLGCASILSPERIFDLSETSNFDPSLSEEGPTKISTAYPTSSVAISDYAGWSLYGAPWLQPVANSGKSTEHGNGGNTPKPLPWVSTGCLRRSMVRRGSTVRVRQRALQKLHAGVCSRRLAGSAACGSYGAVYGAFKLRGAVPGGRVRCRRSGIARTWRPE